MSAIFDAAFFILLSRICLSVFITVESRPWSIFLIKIQTIINAQSTDMNQSCLKHHFEGHPNLLLWILATSTDNEDHELKSTLHFVINTS